jgi:geranylgeranyl pyrophosphate synthase
MPQTSSIGTMNTPTNSFFDLVRHDLIEVEARMRKSSGQHHPSLDIAIENLLSSGGKRIRPTLVLLTGGMLAADREDRITLAAAIELLHTATLVHDDLIDGSKLRRGFPTLNAQWSSGATVLTGDYIFAKAAHLAAGIGSKVLMELFSRTLMTIVNGEVSQLFGVRSENLRQDYFNRIYAKTASLFEASTMGAAILSGSKSEVVERLKIFGCNIGTAFQIVDDVMDFVSEQEYLGKPVARDLRQGLITLPTINYLEGNADGGKLQDRLQRRNIDDKEMEHLIEAIRSSDAIDQALDEASQIITKGEAELDSMPETPEREALHELAHYIIKRTI